MSAQAARTERGISEPILPEPLISVIVPSRGVPPQFARLLSGLAAQAIDPGAYELVVVTGGDPAAVAAQVPPELGFTVRVIAAPGPGPARKRNAGAAAARGRLLVFQDDDMAPETGLLAAHWAAHGDSANRVVMGYLPPEFEPGQALGWWAAQIRAWWDDTFAAMADPGHRFRFTDMLSGNFSIHAELFRQVGGFDPSYFPFDDYEYGVRLLAAGAALAFCPAARSKHVDEAVLVRSMQRIETEGKLCVRMARAYPELGGVLPHWQLAAGESIRMRAVAELARRQPAAATWISLRMAAAAQAAERLGVYPGWFIAAGLAMALRYWVGVWQEAGSWDEVKRLEGRAGVRPSGDVMVVDLAAGLSAAMTRLDACGPAGVVVVWRGARLGELLPSAGAEPLRGRHLRAWMEGAGAEAIARAVAVRAPAASTPI